MPFILALSLYLKFVRHAFESDIIEDVYPDRNLTRVEWENLVNHPFNEYEW